MQNLDCPKCGGNDRVKNGFKEGLQRYKCKDCACNYSKQGRGYPPETRNLAMRMYMEGVGLRTIGRILGVSNVTVLNWVRKSPLNAENKPQTRRAVRQMRIEELCSYMMTRSLEEDSSWLVTEMADRSRPLSILIDGTTA